VALVVTNDDQMRRLSDALTRSGRGLAARLGLANPLAKRFRTALLVGMYALIVFVLVFMTVFASVFEAQSPQVADDTRAGYDLRIDSNATNPATSEQLQADPDVDGVAPIVTALAKFETPGSADSFQRRFSGFDDSLLARGVPALSSRDSKYASDEAVWRAVLQSNDLTIVPSNFLSVGGGPPTSTVDIGEVLTLIDPASGARHRLTIVGIDGAIDPSENGAMVAAKTVPTLVDLSFSGRYYVAVRHGADPAAVGARLESDFLANGLTADTFRALVDSSRSVS
jgi:putative ABC transport system permease protein